MLRFPTAAVAHLDASKNRRIFTEPMSVAGAVSTVEEWLALPGVRVLSPGPQHFEIAFHLLREIGTAANLTTDVQLAALALENQAEVHSNDTDFARFFGLRWNNPLVP